MHEHRMPKGVLGMKMSGKRPWGKPQLLARPWQERDRKRVILGKGRNAGVDR
jgi:hypothetical protein